MPAELETHKQRPIEEVRQEVRQEVREAKVGLGTGASEVALGLMTDGDVPGRRTAEGAADSSDLGGDRDDVGVMVSFGDCLSLTGSWADCAASSEEGETVVAAIGGVRRQRVS